MLKKAIEHLKFRFRQLRRAYQEKYVIPSYDEKRKIIREYQRIFNLDNFVETGTFLGDTVDAIKDCFSELISIELQDELADTARIRFRDIEKIKILKGDSAKLLPKIMTELKLPTLFWLDGHYSYTCRIGDKYIETAKSDKQTPILEELSAILFNGLKRNVILIDDARLFKGNNDYPKISELVRFLIGKGVSDKQLIIKRDIIRIVPK